MTVQVRYKSLHISLLSSALQKREINVYVLRSPRNATTTANFFVFLFGTERFRCIISLSMFLEPLAV